MQTTQPRVRSACEPCHERKQRCIILDGGGPCQLCQQSSRNCFFIPRFKAGRPRRNDSATGSTIGPNPADSRPSTSPVLSSSATVQRRQAYSLPPHAIEPAPTHSEPADQEPDTMTTDNYGNMNDLDIFMASSSSELDMGLSTLLEFSYPPSPTPDAVLNLTERYAEMHRHELLLKQGGPTSPALPASTGYLLPTFITSIDSACTHALSLIRATSTPRDRDFTVSALVALLLATMLKVILLTEAIIDAVESQSTDPQPNQNNSNDNNNSSNSSNNNNRSLTSFHPTSGAYDVESALTFKQLDMSLAQAKHCLYQLGRQQQIGGSGTFADSETLHKTRDLHTRITRLIDKVYDAQWS